MAACFQKFIGDKSAIFELWPRCLGELCGRCEGWKLCGLDLFLR